MKQHPFESHGLGQAPFKLVGCEICEPMAKCDFCGKSIRYRFECEGADRKTFGVGRDCVNKVEATGSPLRLQVDKARKAQEQENLDARVQRLRDQLSVNPSFLRDARHPMRRDGTLRDYAEYVLAYGGPTGLKKICALSEQHQIRKSDK